MTSGYDLLADEYFDSRLHPTIGNLRVGSRYGLRTLGSKFIANGRIFCDIGSGDGSLDALLDAESSIPIHVDLSRDMLRRARGVCVVADATRLPLRTGSIDGIFASLCDPFNTMRFLREARRVLRSGGHLLFSVPDVRWVRHNQEREGVVDAAVVRLHDGTSVTVPSYVYEPDIQLGMLGHAGFSGAVAHTVLVSECIPEEDVSPRLRAVDGSLVSDGLVTMYLATA